MPVWSDPTPTDPAEFVGLRPLPDVVRLRFPRHYADGTAATGDREAWTVDVPVSLFGYATHGPAWPVAVLHDTKAAEFATSASVSPTNLEDLQDLAQQAAYDWCAWRDSAYDRKYHGILAWYPDATADRVEWTWHEEEASTRVGTGPWDGEPEELHHGPPPEATLRVVEDVRCVSGVLKVKTRDLTLEDGLVTEIGGPVEVDAGCCVCESPPCSTLEVTICCRSWDNAVYVPGQGYPNPGTEIGCENIDYEPDTPFVVRMENLDLGTHEDVEAEFRGLRVLGRCPERRHGPLFNC